MADEKQRRETGRAEPLATGPSSDSRIDEALRRDRDFAERLIDTAPVIVLVLDLDGRIVQFNPFMEEVSGHRLEDVRGASWFDTFLPEREQRRVRDLFALSVSGSRVRGNINPILTAGGEERLIEWYDRDLLDSQGNTVGLLAIGRDITDQRRLEEEYLHAQKMEAVGTLAAGVAHDFNNLLMGLIGMADIALGQLEPGHPAGDYLRELCKAAKSGSSVVSELMSFSRRDDAQPVDVQIDTAITRMATMLRTLLGEDVHLILELGAADAYAALPSKKLEQVLMNLCANARHAIVDGGTVTIRTAEVAVLEDDPRCAGSLRGGPHVEMTVSDSGRGMDARTRARIFEPFFTTREEGHGTGLGLASVYGIVQQSRGHIEVESEPGQGASFRILLPRVDPSQRALGSSVGPAPGGYGKTVLVVEDNRLVRMTVRHFLERGGYRVLEAADASEALNAAAAAGDIHVVLSDTVLPGAQGPETVRQLSMIVPDARVVFMSAHPKALLVREQRVDPECEVLEKPFSEKQLLEAVQRAFDGG